MPAISLPSPDTQVTTTGKIAHPLSPKLRINFHPNVVSSLVFVDHHWWSSQQAPITEMLIYRFSQFDSIFSLSQTDHWSVININRADCIEKAWSMDATARNPCAVHWRRISWRGSSKAKLHSVFSSLVSCNDWRLRPKQKPRKESESLSFPEDHQRRCFLSPVVGSSSSLG